MLNAKSDKLDPDILKRLPQQPVTTKEVVTAMKAMANAKAVGPDSLPMKLLKLGLQDQIHPNGASPPYHLHVRQGKSPIAMEKTRSLPYSTRGATRRSAEPTAASRSCHTRVRCSLQWFPEELPRYVTREAVQVSTGLLDHGHDCGA